MFKIEIVQGNDDGYNLELLLSKMKNEGYYLMKIMPHEYETFAHEKPQKYVGNTDCTGELRIRTYLCIFEKK